VSIYDYTFLPSIMVFNLLFIYYGDIGYLLCTFFHWFNTTQVMVFLHKYWKDVMIMKQDKVIHTSVPFNMVSKLFPSIINTHFGTIEPD